MFLVSIPCSELFVPGECFKGLLLLPPLGATHTDPRTCTTCTGSIWTSTAAPLARPIVIAITRASHSPMLRIVFIADSPYVRAVGSCPLRSDGLPSRCTCDVPARDCLGD